MTTLSYLDTLERLAKAATPVEDWLDDLFADQWKPRTEEYLRALSPERVLAMIAVIEAAKAMRKHVNSSAFDAARAKLEEA